MSLISYEESTALVPLSSCDSYVYCLVNQDVMTEEYLDRLLEIITLLCLNNMGDVYGYYCDTYRHIKEVILDTDSCTFLKLDKAGRVQGLIVMVASSSIHHLEYYGTYVNYNVAGSYREFYKCMREYMQSIGVKTLMVSKRVGNSYSSKFINL